MRFYCFPVDPISVNDAYAVNWNRKGRGQDRRLTDVAKAYKQKITRWMEEQDRKFYGGSPILWTREKPWFIVEYAFLIPHSNFYSKNGTSAHPLNKDVTNYFKLVEDAVADHTKINDTRNIVVTGMKTLSEYAGLTRPMVCMTVKQVHDLPSFTVPQGFEEHFSEAVRNYDLL